MQPVRALQIQPTIMRTLASTVGRTATLRHGAVRSRTSRSIGLAVHNKLVLTPIGSGTCDHLGGEKVAHAAAVELKDGTLDVGRVEPADIVLRVPTVSTRHAILTVSGDTVRVADNNSTNGTVVNGADVKAMDYVDVPVGATLVFGDEHLAKFRLDKLPDAAPPPPSEPPAPPAPPAPEAPPAASG